MVPGLAFTTKLERPLQIWICACRSAPTEIDVISKDGIAFKAVIFTAFRLDPDHGIRKPTETLRRLNPALRGADTNHTHPGKLPLLPFAQYRPPLASPVSKSHRGCSNLLDQWVLSVSNGKPAR